MKKMDRIFMYIIGAVVLIWNIAISYWVLSRPGGLMGLDQTTALMVGGLITAANSALMLILGYWYGTSKSSADKDERLANANPS